MDQKQTTRVEAFSDGVFTVAITLLILEIKVPELPPGAAVRELIQALLARWPSFLAFVLSFVTILITWVNHHGLFNLIQLATTSPPGDGAGGRTPRLWCDRRRRV